MISYDKAISEVELRLELEMSRTLLETDGVTASDSRREL